MENTLQIEHGVINSYTPIKFNYSDESAYNNMIKKLEKSDFVVSKQTLNEKGVQLDLKKKFLDINESIIITSINKNKKTSEKEEFKKINEDITVKQIYPDYDSQIPELNDKDSIVFDFIYNFIEVGIPRSNLVFQSEIQSFVENQLSEIVNNTNESSQYFGPQITLNKHVMLLWPILLYDANKKKQLASVSIEFYDYGMAIIKISSPIENQDSNPLTINNTGLYYKSAYYISNTANEIPIENFNYQELSDTNIEIVLHTIRQWIIENIEQSIEIESFLTSETREIIQLNKLIPKNINLSTAKKEEIEAIFRIVNAPIIDKQKFHSNRNIIWKEQFWGDNQIRYIFSTMGKCVAIVGDDLYKSLQDEVPEDVINDYVSETLLIGIENAYKIMLLNRLNSFSYLINQKNVSLKKNKYYEENYYLTENYILGLLDFSYGTVRELYNKIEAVCKEYLNKKSLEKRFNNNERILNKKYKEKEAEENDIFAVLGLLITVLVSFPSIYETLSIIQKELVSNDIPGVSVMRLSIFIEVVFLVILFFWYWNRKK